MPTYAPVGSTRRRVHGVVLAFSGLFMAFSTAVGCSDDPGPGPIPLDELRAELSKASCEQYTRCGQMPNAAICDAVQGDTDVTLQLLTDAVMGRVTYDEAGARMCVEAIRARNCDDLQATRKKEADACARMFVGTVPEGGACLYNAECAGGGSCNTSMCMGGGACCLGVCEKKPGAVALGGDCTTNPCVETAYCDMSAMPFTCKARKDNGEACDAQGQCKEGQRCDVAGSLPTCYLLSDRGKACNPALEAGGCIRYDDYCHPDQRKCVALPGDGQACTTKDECMRYAYCDDTKTCRRRPVKGEACSDTIKCLGTLSCNNMICEEDVSTQVCAY